MNKPMRAAWVRVGVVALAVLAMLLLAAPAEAKFKVKVKSTAKASSATSAPSAPSVSKPRVPDSPLVQTKVETARPTPSVNVAVTPQNRGYFQRIMDWVFGRRPAVAPVAPGPTPAPVAPPAVGVAPVAPGRPPLVVPVALPAAAPASPASSATAQGTEKELEKLPDLTPPPPRPEPVVKGYILHLKNGRRISTFHYEEKGGQIVIPQHGGTFGLSKSLISRIEVVKE